VPIAREQLTQLPDFGQNACYTAITTSPNRAMPFRRLKVPEQYGLHIESKEQRPRNRPGF